MKTEVIDLYEYFGLTRPEFARGYLTLYIQNASDEYKNRIRPAILVIPGGGYCMTSDREREPIALAFMAKGYNAFTLDYSVAPTRFPSQLTEAVLAAAYIKKNAEKLGIDNRLAAIGFSAGSHLLGTLLTMYNSEYVEIAAKNLGGERPIDAAVFSYPVVSAVDHPHVGSFLNLFGENKSFYEEVSFEKHIGKTFPPSFIWTTVDDNCVPSENSLNLALQLKKHSVPFELHAFESGVHGLSLCTKQTYNNIDKNLISPDVEIWFDLAIKFLTRHGFEIKMR